MQVYSEPFTGSCEACGVLVTRVRQVFEENSAAPDQVCVDEAACTAKRMADCASDGDPGYCWCMGCPS